VIANTFLDIYTIIFSWQVYGAIWDTLNGTGLAYIPFIVAIISSLQQSYDQSPSRIVSTLEFNLLGMILVLMLVVIPYDNNNISLSEVKYSIASTSCQNPEQLGDGDNTGETADDVFADMAGGSPVKIPIAWALVDYFSSAITFSAIKAMGCSNDYNDVLVKVGNVSIDDPAMLGRLNEFNKRCYRPALKDLEENGMPAGADRDTLKPWDDPSFIGSNVFLNTPGRFFNAETAYVHQAQRYGFTYDPTPGSLDEKHDEDTFGATVSCADLWNDPNHGLRKDLLESIQDTSEGDDAWDDWDDYGSDLYGSNIATNADKEDSFIKTILDANAGGYNAVDDIDITSSNGSVDKNIGQKMLDGVTDIVVGGAAAISNLGNFSEMWMMKKAMKTALPMLVSMAQALIVILAPLAMVWGMYKMQNFVILALAYFGLEFLNAVLGMGFFFENRIVEMSNAAIFEGPLASLVVFIVSILQVIVLPIIWLSLIGATGASALQRMGGSVTGGQKGQFGGNPKEASDNVKSAGREPGGK